MNEMIIDAITAEKRLAVREDGRTVRLLADQPKDRSEVGNIYVGVVETVKPGINAAFVKLGGGRKNGFLQRNDLPSYIHSDDAEKDRKPISAFIRQGEKLLVQVKKDATGRKGPQLSAVIEFPGKRIVYMPEGKYIAVTKKAPEPARNFWRTAASRHKEGREGLIIRTGAIEGTEEEFLAELAGLREEYAKLQDRLNRAAPPKRLKEESRFFDEVIRECARLKEGVIFCNSASVTEALRELPLAGSWSIKLVQGNENIFSRLDAEKELEKALKRIVWLENGAYLIIDETEAAVVIDVNTGKFTGKTMKSDTILETNRLAAEEIARQLQLRDIGGMILIDFIDMKAEGDRKQITAALAEALRHDPSGTRLLGFTPLGIFELTRKRTKHSLAASLMEDCPACGGRGKVLSPETNAFRLERELRQLPPAEHEAVLVECDAETEEAFSGEEKAYLGKIEEELGLKIFFRERPGVTPGYEIRRFGTSRDILAGMERT